ncbi:MAG: PDZ domain-containing protein [Bacilli bacterium]|nr:PDZ domain-containing protein [Bacilli bacterium]
MKIYEKIINFIKKNYKTLTIYVLLIAIFTINLPYYISAPGGLLDTSKKIKSDENFKLNGSLNMAYVTEIHASIPTYLWSFIQKDWDLEKEKDAILENEKEEDVMKRNKMLLTESNKVALLVAYSHSNVEYEVVNDKVFISYIDKQAKTDLKIGDQILEVDGKKVVDKNYLMSYIKSKNVGDKVEFKVKGEKNKTATLIDVDGTPKVGAMITEDFDVKSDKKVNFNFSSSESGPSGGLMITLALYSNLNKIDLTKGKKIAGTGTIDINGNVGEISGVKYKLIGAVNEKADVFLVPEGKNYKEAKKIKKERGYKIDIVPVETFEEALNYLNK